MSENIVRTLLQAEIMALLHDVGKLHWNFVGSATGDENKLQAKHTTDFWSEAKNPLFSFLHWELPESWLVEIKDRKPKYLGSLLQTHHGKLYKECFANCDIEYPELMLLMMYADTADSLFAKGGGGDGKQSTHIHLAHPQGGKQYLCEKEQVEADAKALADALNAWFDSNAASWNRAMLAEKRQELMGILQEFGSRHMAETRLPNNDVTLWQHSYSVASIFKALLAYCLYGNTWGNLLSAEKELAHAKQELSMLAIRWNAEEWIGRSLRSFEVVGRQRALAEMTKSIKILIEEELALGNEIYGDHTGICFLVPSMPESLEQDSPMVEVLQRIAARVDELVNTSLIHGDLAWHMQTHTTGLRLTGLLDFWHNEEHPSLLHGPRQPRWMQEWDTAQQKQICPRCGLRPIDFSHSRSGSSGDTACEQCKNIAQSGYKLLKSMSRKENTTAEKLFGLQHMAYDDTCFEFIEWENQSVEAESRVWGSRLALVQGVLDMHAVQKGDFCDLLLNILNDTTWQKELLKVQESWEKCCSQVENTRGFFKKLFGNPPLFAEERDGWCAYAKTDATDNDFVQAYADALIFCGERQKEGYVKDSKAEARQILLWALRQHPAPSRMARLWDEAHAFMQKPFQLAQQGEESVPFVPLHCDISSFQMLVPAKQALAFMQNVASQYAKTFGQVRHMLPLHLSSAVFYHKAPLYIAMDSARRFKGVRSSTLKLWTLQEKTSAEKNMYTLQWSDHLQRLVTWHVPAVLPDGSEDRFRGWFWNEAGEAIHIKDIQQGQKYKVLPSTFDFEVLDASTRRYDIFYEGSKPRPHFMMPHDGPCPYSDDGPRPYSLEVLETWKEYSVHFSRGVEGQGQRHVALELLAKLHMTWQERRRDSVFAEHAKNILLNTLGKEALALYPTMIDGTFFDLCEWYDFINK